MRKLKILYVHGYMGHGNGNASQLVKAAFEKRGIDVELDAPDFPVTEPDKMKELLNDMMTENCYNYVVASSLGAFYTLQTFGQYRILVNPALPENLLRLRENDEEEKKKNILTDEFIEKLEESKEYFFDVCHDHESRFFTYFVFGNQDRIAGNEEFFKQYYYYDDQAFHVDMEHRMNEAGAEKVVDIIEKLETEKPVYIDPLEACCEYIFRDGMD